MEPLLPSDFAYETGEHWCTAADKMTVGIKSCIVGAECQNKTDTCSENNMNLRPCCTWAAFLNHRIGDFEGYVSLLIRAFNEPFKAHTYTHTERESWEGGDKEKLKVSHLGKGDNILSPRVAFFKAKCSSLETPLGMIVTKTVQSQSISKKGQQSWEGSLEGYLKSKISPFYEHYSYKSTNTSDQTNLHMQVIL